MIIADDAPRSPAKGSAPPNALNQPAGPNQAQRISSPPPAYPAYQPIYHSSAPLIGGVPDRLASKAAAKRFFRAFFIVVFCIGLLNLLGWSTRTLVRRFERRHGHQDWTPGKWREDVKVPQGVDGTIDRCIDWFANSTTTNIKGQDWGFYSAKTSFSLPISSDLLFLVADGSLTSGDVKLDTSSESGDQVKVDVIVHYYSDEALKRADLCYIHRSKGENGVGIFTPKRWNGHSPYDQLRFEINVLFPVSYNFGPLRIKAFETKLSLFSHHIGDLEDDVSFGDLNLRSSNAAITSQYLQAENATIETSNSPITGTFAASKQLHLVTSNARIETTLELSNANERLGTELLLKTSNGHISSDITLLSTARNDRRGGTFNGRARTSNGRIEISYPESPVDSELNFEAQTSNSAATVQLHPAYEGQFHVKTSNSGPSVSYRPVPDPAGEGRKRTVDIRRVGDKEVEGDVFWGANAGRGSVTVRTSNSPAILMMD